MNKYQTVFAFVFIANLSQTILAMEPQQRRKTLGSGIKVDSLRDELKLELMLDRPPKKPNEQDEIEVRLPPLRSRKTHKLERDQAYAKLPLLPPKYIAVRKKSSDDSDIGLETLEKSMGPMPRFPSNEVLAMGVKSKKKWDIKLPTLKKNKLKKESEVEPLEVKSPKDERREALYLREFDRIYQVVNTFDLLSAAEKEIYGSKKFNDLGKAESRGAIYGVVRNSDSFKDEYKSLRIAAKIHLDAHLSEIMNHDLKFLKKCFKWNSMYEKKYKKEAKFSTEMLSSEEVENLVNKLSNKKGSLARQNAYVEFLGEQILELVKGTPREVRSFFYRMAIATRDALANNIEGQDENSAFGPWELATSNFMLYVINPLLLELEPASFSFEGKLKLMEDNELIKILKLSAFPEPGSEDEQKLIDGVVERMNRARNEYFRESGRKLVETALVKLLQKTFMEESEFSAADYADFIGEFYITLGKNGSALNKRLKDFKTNVQSALFDGFDV